SEVHRRILATKEVCQGSNKDPRYQEKDERGIASIYGSVQVRELAYKGCAINVAYLNIYAWSWTSGLAKKLNDKITRTMDEIFKRVRAFIRGEAAAGSAKIARAL
ncbi:hypothetical protein Tco_0284606, partial [Tanacetum coccineum]